MKKLLGTLCLVLLLTGCEGIEDMLGSKDGDDDKGEGPDGGRPCTEMAAVGTVRIELKSTNPIPPLLAIQVSGLPYASDCENGMGMGRIEREGGKVVVSRPHMGPSDTAYNNLDIYELSACAPGSATLIKSSAVATVEYENETAYPNGKDCPSMEITNGTGEISLD